MIFQYIITIIIINSLSFDALLFLCAKPGFTIERLNKLFALLRSRQLILIRTQDIEGPDQRLSGTVNILDPVIQIF